MRGEREVYALLTEFFHRDGNIRVAVLNGSRANQNAPPDFMRDYDVALYVQDFERARAYSRERSWVSGFGSLVMLQQNSLDDGSLIFLLQYDDSLRIDLSFHDVGTLRRKLESDSLSVPLYDPDGLCGGVSEADETSYYVRMPDRRMWDESLNDLWWVQGSVAKGLWRNELPFVKFLYDEHAMPRLRDLLSWHIGAARGWKVNAGKGGKWLGRLLEPDVYGRFLALYSCADACEQWEKLLRFGGFVHEIGLPLSKKLGYEYPLAYDRNMSAFIRRIKALPADAESM